MKTNPPTEEDITKAYEYCRHDKTFCTNEDEFHKFWQDNYVWYTYAFMLGQFKNKKKAPRKK